MMSSHYLMSFTSADGKCRALELRDDQLHLSWRPNLDIGKDVITLAIYMEGQQAGMTTDDRGVPDWDAPVAVDFAISWTALSNMLKDPAPLKWHISTAADHTAGFLYHWDHRSFTWIDCSVSIDEIGIVTLNISAHEEQGGAFAFEGTLSLSFVSCEVFQDHTEQAKNVVQAYLGANAAPKEQEIREEIWRVSGQRRGV